MKTITCDECGKQVSSAAYRNKVVIMGPLCDDINMELHFHQGKCYRQWKRKFKAFMKEATARVKIVLEA